jgi:hypothetical protein
VIAGEPKLGTPSLNGFWTFVNPLGAKNILKNGTTALAANDILAGQIAEVIYEGPAFQMQSQSGSAVSGLSTVLRALIFMWAMVLELLQTQRCRAILALPRPGFYRHCKRRHSF